jgi:CubicO group peptidase (beta-lactamase class C family)
MDFIFHFTFCFDTGKYCVVRHIPSIYIPANNQNLRWLNRGSMEKMAKRWLGIIGLVFMLASCATMPERPENPARHDYNFTTEYITWLIKKEMKEHDVTGLSIALVDDQRVVWAEGFGFADKANKVQATPETIYRAGSISKLFTATSVMQLVEQGKLDIDKPLQTYLPEFSIKSRFPNVGPITPRTLMTHHSGLPSDFTKGMWTKNPEPFENIVTQIKDDYVAHPPNFVFSYSNMGVTLLGHALEQVTGRAYASYMDASILSPLGMTHSSFSLEPDRSSFATKAYRKGQEAEETALRDLPAGGLNTTVVDFSRFMQMVFAGGQADARQIIKSETLAEMLRPQNADVALDLGFRIGLAWILDSADIQNAGLVAGHGGATLYHRSQLIVLPEHKLGIVVLANSDTAGSVASKVATEALKLALEAKTGIKQPDQKKETPGEAILTQKELQSYEGYYDTVVGVVKVSSESNYLWIKAMNKTLRLIPRTDGLFYLQYRLLGLIPVSLGKLDNIGISLAMIAGRDILQGRVNGRELLLGDRIQPVPIPEKLLQRIGEYEIVNRENDAVILDNVRLRQDNDLLFVDYSVPLFSNDTMSLAVMPLSDSDGVIYGLGRGKGETIRFFNKGGEELCGYSGYLLRKKRE